MELKKLVKNASYLASTRVIQFLVGLVRAKINAVYLGTTGVGVVNQLVMVTQKMSRISTLSMNEGLVKQIAESKNDEDFITVFCSAVKTYIALIISLLFISMVFLTIFSKSLTYYVFGDEKYHLFLIIGIFSFPILVFNSIPFAILKGFKSIKFIAYARIIFIVINLILFVPLVIYFKLIGAVVFVALSFITMFLANSYYVKKYYLNHYSISLKNIFQAKWKKEYFKELFTFAGIGLAVGTIRIVSDLYCRSIVVTDLGIENLGLYSPIITWSGLFIGFILPALNTYLYPRFCETKSDKEINGILNDAQRLSIFLLCPLILLAIPFRYILIPLFYSQDFVAAGDYLPYHFWGIIFYVMFYAFSMVLTPTGRIKQQGFFMITYAFVDMIIVYFLVPVIGLYGWMLKHVISPLLFFGILYIYLRKITNFKFTKANITIILYLIISTSIMLCLILFSKNSILINYIWGPLSLIFVVFFTTPKERLFVRKKIQIPYDKFFKK